MTIIQNYSENLPSDLVEILEPYRIDSPLFSEPDFYGASSLIAQRLNFKKVPRSYSSWSHGCHTANMKYKEQIIWGDGWVRNILVRNQFVKDFLNAAGLERVHAVGLPIVYVERSNINRKPKSLLFMPVHSLSYLDIEHDIDSMINEAVLRKSQGVYVCFCLHRDCVKQGKIYSELDNLGIDWFVGSSVDDSNSLQRMRNIFEYFEVTTSNTIGSHFYYSQLFGCKFYFSLPYFEYKLSTNANAPHWKDKQHILAYDLAELAEESIRRKFPNYFCNYSAAFCDQDMARGACGVDCKRSPEEIAKLLGWGSLQQFICKLHTYSNRVYNKINASSIFNGKINNKVNVN